jgi:N-acetylmuramic acid 6-phosphate etherase
MSLPVTEHLHPASRGLDTLPGADVLRHLLDQQSASLAALSPALPAIEAAAQRVAETYRAGGRIVYAGAGSSALMAIADGMELAGTYGIDPARVLLLMAGGLPTDARMPGDTEDDAEDGARAAATIRAGDVVIAVTASGSTPYPVAVARSARAKGAQVIAIANNRDAALFADADVAICIETPPEVIAGSTRMGAGTAQKAALNMISTRAGILLGQVHDGMMVGLRADNAKLARRATDMVAVIAGVGEAAATAALQAAGMAVKPAVLIALGATPSATAALLADTQDNLRAALARLQTTGTRKAG